ncbi:MAG: YbgC/FadM family acyl-CoA thioesterase [Proteobacteria bacterium]|nr:YbgC/FadM family acyl-CoA thioesterase [Pseudomonadota bacterium]
MDIRIYYEDTDCGGVVYYANYLKYFERARTDFFRERGIDIASLSQRGILFVVSKVDVSYRYPAGYNDIISIETRLSELKGASFNLNYAIRRKADGKLLVSGNTLMAAVDGRRKPLKITGDLRDKFNSILSSAKTA